MEVIESVVVVVDVVVVAFVVVAAAHVVVVVWSVSEWLHYAKVLSRIQLLGLCAFQFYIFFKFLISISLCIHLSANCVKP